MRGDEYESSCGPVGAGCFGKIEFAAEKEMNRLTLAVGRGHDGQTLTQRLIGLASCGVEMAISTNRRVIKFSSGRNWRRKQTGPSHCG
jgi:hypothetical protein